MQGGNSKFLEFLIEFQMFGFFKRNFKILQLLSGISKCVDFLRGISKCLGFQSGISKCLELQSGISKKLKSALNYSANVCEQRIT